MNQFTRPVNRSQKMSNKRNKRLVNLLVIVLYILLMMIIQFQKQSQKKQNQKKQSQKNQMFVFYLQEKIEESHQTDSLQNTRNVNLNIQLMEIGEELVKLQKPSLSLFFQKIFLEQLKKQVRNLNGERL